MMLRAVERGGSACLNRLAVWISGLPLVDHDAGRSGWSKYTWSGVLAPRAEQLEDWLDSLDPPAAGVSMIDGYLAALVVSPQFIPPEDWRPRIVSDRIVWALEGSVEATVRNALF